MATDTITEISQKIRQAGMGLDPEGAAPAATEAEDPEVNKEALARFGAGSATCLSDWSGVPTPELKKLIDDLPKKIDDAVKRNDTPTAEMLRKILSQIAGEYVRRKDKKMAALGRSMQIKGVQFEIIRREDGQWNSGFVVSIDDSKHHIIKQGGMNLWAFAGRPALEKKIGRDGMNAFDAWLGSELGNQ
jgi:hypothetical protein